MAPDEREICMNPALMHPPDARSISRKREKEKSNNHDNEGHSFAIMVVDVVVVVVRTLHEES